jgi:ABC-2 type transport system permease protein
MSMCRADTPGASFSTTVVQTARRTTLQFVRSPQLLITGSIQGAIYLFMFRYVLGGAIDADSTRFIEFLAPGFVTTVALWNAMTVPAGVAEDAASGVYDRMRSLPIPRIGVMVGRSVADTGLLAWGVLTTMLFSLAIGFRFHGDAAEVTLAFALLLATTFAFSWLFISLGLLARNAQAAQGLGMLVIPLAFVSSAYVPVESMPGWLQVVAARQPVTVISNAVRSLMLGGSGPAGVGHDTGYWLGLSLLWCAGISMMFGAIAISRFAKAR